MSALALPRRLKLNSANIEMCKRIGVRFNGEDCGKSIIAYDTGKNTITLTDGTIKTGIVEPYWR